MSGTRVRRSRSGGGGGGGFGKAFSNPVTPVLIGLAIVLGVGFWVMREDKPASSTAKTQQSDKGASSSPSGQAGTGSQSGTGAESGTGAQSGTPAASGNGSGTPSTTPATPPASSSQTGTGSGTGTGTGGAAAGFGSGSGSGTAKAPADDQAMLAARSKINRAGSAAKTMLVTAYYSDGLKEGLSLQPVEIKVEQTVGRLTITVDQLLNPPQDLKLYSNIPAGTKRLGGVNLKDGVAYVDLSPEVTRVRGAAAVNNIMASFVYSLTAVPNVKAVQLWVNGRPAMLDGMEWSKPLSKAEMDARNLFKVEPVVKYAGQ